MLISYYHFYFMEQKQKRGGARPNAGRKGSGIKKKPITVYLPESVFDLVGKEKIKETILQTFKPTENGTA